MNKFFKSLIAGAILLFVGGVSFAQTDIGDFLTLNTLWTGGDNVSGQLTADINFLDNLGNAGAWANFTIDGAGHKFDGRKKTGFKTLSAGQTLTFLNLNFMNFMTSTYGGAIWASQSTMTFNGPINFTSNTANYGGAIFASQSTMTFNEKINFTGNIAVGASVSSGGAIFASQSTITFNGEINFTSNSANYGGAIYAEGGSLIEFIAVGNILFRGNKANGAANDIYLDNSGLYLDAGVYQITMEGGIKAYNGSVISWANGAGGSWVLGGINEFNGLASFNTAEQSLITVINASWTYVSNATLELSNSTMSFINSSVSFVNNEGDTYDGLGAISLDSNSQLNFTKSIVNFTSNTSHGEGGAISIMDFSQANFGNSSVSFTGNSGNYGAIFLTYASFANFADSVVSFTSNTAVYGGGAINIDSYFSSASFTNSVVSFTSNTAVYGGGAIIISDNDLQVDFENSSVSFVGNSVSGLGGAIFISHGEVNFTKSIVNFTSNTVDSTDIGGGGAIALAYDDQVAPILTFSNTKAIFEGNNAPSGKDIYNQEGSVINILAKSEVILRSGINGDGNINIKNAVLRVTADGSNTGGTIAVDAGTFSLVDLESYSNWGSTKTFTVDTINFTNGATWEIGILGATDYYSDLIILSDRMSVGEMTVLNIRFYKPWDAKKHSYIIAQGTVISPENFVVNDENIYSLNYENDNLILTLGSNYWDIFYWNGSEPSNSLLPVYNGLAADVDKLNIRADITFGGALSSMADWKTLTIRGVKSTPGSDTAQLRTFDGVNIYPGFSLASKEMTFSYLSFNNFTTSTYGGAIWASQSTITFNGQISFIGNTAASNGGAVSLDNTQMSLTKSSVSFINNTSNGNGGAIYLSNNSQLTFENSTVSFIGNQAKEAGAIFIAGGTVTFVNSSVNFAGNRATNETSEDSAGAITIGGGAYLNFINTAANFEDNDSAFWDGNDIIVDGIINIIEGSKVTIHSQINTNNSGTINIGNGGWLKVMGYLENLDDWATTNVNSGGLLSLLIDSFVDGTINVTGGTISFVDKDLAVGYSTKTVEVDDLNMKESSRIEIGVVGNANANDAIAIDDRMTITGDDIWLDIINYTPWDGSRRVYVIATGNIDDSDKLQYDEEKYELVYGSQKLTLSMKGWTSWDIKYYKEADDDDESLVSVWDSLLNNDDDKILNILAYMKFTDKLADNPTGSWTKLTIRGLDKSKGAGAAAIRTLDGNNNYAGFSLIGRTLTFLDLNFVNFSTSTNGGAIFVSNDSQVNFTSSTINFTGNNADGNGGAIYNDSMGELIFRNSKVIFEGNNAASGKDIYNNGVINILAKSEVILRSGINGGGEINIENAVLRVSADNSNAEVITVKGGGVFSLVDAQNANEYSTKTFSVNTLNLNNGGALEIGIVLSSDTSDLIDLGVSGEMNVDIGGKLNIRYFGQWQTARSYAIAQGTVNNWEGLVYDKGHYLLDYDENTLFLRALSDPSINPIKDMVNAVFVANAIREMGRVDNSEIYENSYKDVWVLGGVKGAKAHDLTDKGYEAKAGIAIIRKENWRAGIYGGYLSGTIEDENNDADIEGTEAGIYGSYLFKETIKLQGVAGYRASTVKLNAKQKGANFETQEMRFGIEGEYETGKQWSPFISIAGSEISHKEIKQYDEETEIGIIEANQYLRMDANGGVKIKWRGFNIRGYMGYTMEGGMPELKYRVEDEELKAKAAEQSAIFFGLGIGGEIPVSRNISMFANGRMHINNDYFVYGVNAGLNYKFAQNMKKPRRHKQL
ncbi:MAG: hypothetical protein LBQ37_04825 [Elusimicrobiota bacterium]|nr:hypothetical protein [Elusimicrobiota bacterium]